MDGWTFAEGLASMVHAALVEGRSPIERQFGCAIASAAYEHRVLALRESDGAMLPVLHERGIEGVLVYKFQKPIDRYFADLYLELHVQHSDGRHPLLRDDGATRLVVECDGHDFHDRTKEQASSDRARDRKMALSGYQVFRFTGSDIWRDPFKCADDALEMLGVRLAGRADRPQPKPQTKPQIEVVSPCAFCGEREGAGTLVYGDGGAWSCKPCGDALVATGYREAAWAHE